MRLPSQKPAGVYPSAQGLSTEKHAPDVGIRLRRDLAVSRPSGVEYGKLVVKTQGPEGPPNEDFLWASSFRFCRRQRNPLELLQKNLSIHVCSARRKILLRSG